MPADDDRPGARVIGLTQHRGYRPDLAALARDQVVTAREKLGLDREEFAALLEPLLGWRPSADVVEGWETQATPPGDVILAAGLAIQRTPSEVLTVGLSPNAERVIGLVSSVIGEAERLAGSPDVVRAYGMRGLIGRSTWNERTIQQMDVDGHEVR